MIFLSTLLFGFSSEEGENALKKVKEVFSANREIKSMKYDFYKKERIKGVMVDNESFVKYQKKPYKFYLRESFPNDGLEVLFPHPLDDGSALVNPSGFPWINVKLDPIGELMTNGQHHTIFESGFDYMVSIVEFSVFKYKTKMKGYVSWEGITLFDGNTCDIIVMENPNFGYLKYAVSEGESIKTIAKKYRLSEYMLREKNQQINYINDLKQGDVLSIPSDYASKMILLLDKKRHIPLKMEIYDDLGIFEVYEFTNVIINPKFQENEFFETFPEYGFN